jgi:hypothetical protein
MLDAKANIRVGRQVKNKLASAHGGSQSVGIEIVALNEPE